MKKIVKEYFIGWTVVNVIFWILYWASEKFRKKYWNFCMKLIDKGIEVLDKIEEKIRKK